MSPGTIWTALDRRVIDGTITVDDVVEASKVGTPSPGDSYVGDHLLALDPGRPVDRRAAVDVITRAARDLGCALSSLERVLR